jgi:hypothetical protein
MKCPSLLHFSALLFGGLSLAMAPISSASDQFRITTIAEARSTDLIEVGKAWRKDLPKRLRVSLRVNEEIVASKVQVKGYFYDKDDNLVHTAQKPNAIWTRTPRGIESVSLPKILEKGKPFDVYFALPEELEAKKWKTILVVFGDSNGVSAKSRPAAAIERLDYPEKALATKSAE